MKRLILIPRAIVDHPAAILLTVTLTLLVLHAGIAQAQTQGFNTQIPAPPVGVPAGADPMQAAAYHEAMAQSYRKQGIADLYPHMAAAVAQVTMSAANCTSDASDSGFLNVGRASKRCREVGELGLGGLCMLTVAMTGDTRDLAQCVAMVNKPNPWPSVWKTGLLAGAGILGLRELTAFGAGVTARGFEFGGKAIDSNQAIANKAIDANAAVAGAALEKVPDIEVEPLTAGESPEEEEGLPDGAQ